MWKPRYGHSEQTHPQALPLVGAANTPKVLTAGTEGLAVGQWKGRPHLHASAVTGDA